MADICKKVDDIRCIIHFYICCIVVIFSIFYFFIPAYMFMRFYRQYEMTARLSGHIFCVIQL